MMAKMFYFVYLFSCGVCLARVSAYGSFNLLSVDDNNTDVANISKYNGGSSDFIKLHRVKRANPNDSTMMSYPANEFTSVPTALPVMITSYNGTPIYVITGFTEQVQTTSLTSQMPPITSSSSTTRVTTARMNTTITSSLPTTTVSTYNPDTCNLLDYVKLVNGSCIAKSAAQSVAVDIVRSGAASSVDRANGLSLYISSITNSTNLRNSTNVLSVSEMDRTVANLSGVNLTVDANTSFVMVQQPNQDNVIILGASFKRSIGGATINTTNKDNVTNSNVSAAAIVARESLLGVTSLNMVIIDKPTGFEDADNSTNKTLASSVIIVNLRRNTSRVDPMLLSLYFSPLSEYKRNGSGQYLCSYYNTSTSTWSEDGCTKAILSTRFNRYECNCSHTTSFALIWLPQSLSTATNSKQLDAQDIASLVFQCLSIVCFLVVLIHAIAIRTVNPLLGVPALNLLPLISTASTTVLFVFFIALSMTVYTQTSTADQAICFPSASVLMFMTYFLLIFMFGVKAIAGYFYFLRFVRLFPQPSHRELAFMLAIAFLIASVGVAFAIGFNARSSTMITQLYPYKLCWFTRPAIYYFMVIPIGMSLVFNVVVIVLVSRSLFAHARNASTSRQINERLKRCVIVLLSSCVTQGIGWLFGPVISLVNPTAAAVLGWFLIVINGLEGLWSIIIYVLIRLQQMADPIHVTAATELSLSRPSQTQKAKDKTNREKTRSTKVPMYSFNDLRKRETMGDHVADDARLK